MRDYCSAITRVEREMRNTSCDSERKTLARTLRILKVWAHAETMYHHNWPQPTKENGASQELIDAFHDIYMRENDLYW